MKRGLLLLTLFLTVVTTSVACWQPGETVQAETESKPVIVPYLNIDIKTVPTVAESHQMHENVSNLFCTGEFEQIPIEEENTPEWIYMGVWTTTAYCPCEICCGEWATGCTASGVLATSNHTVACGILPFGTQVLIGDTVYTVEDTGVYGEWVDIFFDSHEEALNYGIQEREVYILVNPAEN